MANRQRRKKQGPLFGRRTAVLLGAMLAVGALLIARLAQMQLFWHSAYEQDLRAGSSIVETTRGAIYTYDGVLLARDVPVFNLSVHYSRLSEEDPDNDWKPTVSRLTGVSAEELAAGAEDIVRRVERIWQAVRRNTGIEDLRILEQTQYHPVVEDILPEVASLVRKEPDRFPGLKVTVARKRIYNRGELAPHIVGRCGLLWAEDWQELSRNNNTWTSRMPVSEIDRRYCLNDRLGRSGIEKAYEGLLRGNRGYVQKHWLIGTLRLERRTDETPPEPGLDLYLTLRLDFQQAANEALQWAAEQPHLSFTKGALVILDVRTGAILAASTYPSYDLVTFNENFEVLRSDERSPLLFRPTQAALPIGSVYKLVTAVAALKEGKITPSTTFHCAGYETFRGRPFHCTSRWGHRQMTLLPAIEHSCNVYFFNTAALLDNPALARWGRAFGLGALTGVDLPFERSGQVPEPRALFDRLNLAIGQGRLLCTPLQVARMCAAIANGGKLVEPHFFDSAVSSEGKVVRIFESRVHTVGVSAETLRLVREGMHRVVLSGTARRAFDDLAQFDVAGKTGTAELGSATTLNHAWFAGFAPFDSPKIAFAVVSERTPGHGGSHAAPIVAHALEKIWPQVEKMP